MGQTQAMMTRFYAAVLHGEIERMAAADLMRLGLRWVLANRAAQQTGRNSTIRYNDTDWW